MLATTREERARCLLKLFISKATVDSVLPSFSLSINRASAFMHVRWNDLRRKPRIYSFHYWYREYEMRTGTYQQRIDKSLPVFFFPCRFNRVRLSGTRYSSTRHFHQLIIAPGLGGGQYYTSHRTRE